MHRRPPFSQRVMVYSMGTTAAHMTFVKERDEKLTRTAVDSSTHCTNGMFSSIMVKTYATVGGLQSAVISKHFSKEGSRYSHRIGVA